MRRGRNRVAVKTRMLLLPLNPSEWSLRHRGSGSCSSRLVDSRSN